MGSRLSWPGAYPPLCSSLSLSQSVFFHPLLPYLLSLALSVYPPSFPLQCPFLSSLPLSISRCHNCSGAFFTSLPCDIPLFLFLPALSSFVAMPLLLLSFCECVALAILLALPMRLTLDQHDWTWPHGSCWLASSQQKEVS